MNRNKIIVFVMIIFILLLSGCNETESNKNDRNFVEIPIENKIELEEIWQVKMDKQQSDYAIEGDKLYVVTWENIIYIMNINSGEILKKFKLDSINKKYCSGIAVYNGNLAINYNNRIIVVDTNEESIIFEYEATKSPIMALEYYILMKYNLLIFSNRTDDKIYAMDYITKKVQWEIGGDVSKHGKLSLRKYKDKYLYTKGKEFAYYEFDPLTGKTIRKYICTSGGEIKNENQSYFIPLYSDVEDNDFRTWLRRISFDVFDLTDKGYIYTYYGEHFYFHGIDGKLSWQVKFPKEIYISEGYGKYAILDFRDAVSIFDMETKEVVWNSDYKIASKPRFFIYEDRLYLPGKDGSFKVMDLSKLEK